MNTPRYNETHLLRSLLSKFVEIVYVTDTELESMADWILSKQLAEEDTRADDSEIYETIVYLRDLAQESNYQSIGELAAYFEEQRRSLGNMVEPLLSDDEEKLSVSSLNRIFTFAFKTPAIRTLTGTSYVPPTCSYLDIAQHLSERVNMDLSIDNMAYRYKELNLAVHCLRSLNVLRDPSWQVRILPHSNFYYFKNYFESFSRPSRAYTRIISWIKKVRSWFTVPSAEELKRQQKLKSLYTKIWASLEAEQPIRNDNFKTMLSRLMLTSKLNNPVFRENMECVRSVMIDEHHHLDFSLSASGFICKKTYYKYLSEKKWSILKSPDGCSWITSDNPGFSIDITPLYKETEQVHADPYWMAIDGKSMIYFPLSKQYCLRLLPAFECGHHAHDHDNDEGVISFELSTEEELKAVNKLVISSRPQVVISEEKGIQLQCSSEC